MAKSEEKFKAIKFRKKGQSIKEIARKLGVSTSSVSLWCRDIVLTPSQIERLEKRAKDPLYGKRMEYIKKIKDEKNKKILRMRKTAIKEIGRLSDRELFLVGVSLYWAEGFKKDSRAGFASSDPKMIQTILRWLFRCFKYTQKDISLRVTANISHKYRIKDIENYWVNETNLPSHIFQKPFFQNTKWKKHYDNPHNYHGVLRIRVKKSTDFLRKIHGWIEGLSKQI